MEDISTLSEEQKWQMIRSLWQQIQEISASLHQSKWHTAFEAILRLDFFEYGDKISITAEKVLGEEPPRADFLVLVDKEGVSFKKAIFRNFRQQNVIEYKRPDDSLNDRTLRKAIAYANHLIALAEHEEDVPPDQVTITIFRSKENPYLFKQMLADGRMTKDEVEGIYHVHGYTDLPFQVIVTSELAGDEYAAYRALTKDADMADVEKVMDDAISETDEVKRRHYRVLLDLISEKNPNTVEELKRRNPNMGPKWKEIFKDEIDDEKRQTTLENIKSVMASFGVTAQRALQGFSIKEEDRPWFEERLGIKKA